MEHKSIPVRSITEADRNLNVMQPSEFEALTRAIKRVGFLQPVLVRAGPIASDGAPSNYTMVDGHHRLRAACELGMAEVPAVVIGFDEEMPSDEIIAVSMNRIRGQVDLAGVALLAQELYESGTGLEDLGLMGFSEQELKELIDTASGSDLPDLSDMSTTMGDEPEPDHVARPFLLELTFKSSDEVKKVKKALRKAAGKGADLSFGLLRLIGEDA